METKKYVWRGEALNTAEYTVITNKGSYYQVNGHISGADEGIAFHVQYTLQIDHDWVMQSVSIQFDSELPFSWSFTKDNEGRWQDEHGSMLPELDDCVDIDIALTPFTNTLAVNRLRLQAGQSQEITVLYFNLPHNEFKPARQRYTNLGHGYYKFEALDTGFITVIQTDGDGFVTSYPGLWKRVYHG
jgi:hypothetical protein